jgi:glycosyltransferase involved in cell wall biosynthesis
MCKSNLSGKKLNIVVIHEVSYIDKPVYEYQDFAERLAARGHRVTVIDFCESRKGSLTAQKISRTGLGEIELITLPNNGIPVLKYITAKVQFPSLLKKLINETKIDAVLLYSVFINGTGTIAICKKAGIPVVYRAIDAYHRLRKDPFQSWLLLQCEKFIYTNAETLSATNAKMAAYVAELSPDRRKEPAHITDHGVDTTHFRRLPFDKSLAAKLSIYPDDFVCLFLGTTYHFSRLDLLIRQISSIRKSIKNFKLLILGAGELDQSIRDTAIREHVTDFVVCPGMISYEDLPSYMSLARIAINPFAINEITKDIIPIKILQYLAAELPIVSTPLPDLVCKIPHEISGTYYSADDTMESFTQSILDIAGSIDLEQAGQKARTYVSEHHSMESVISELEGLLGKKWNI